MQQHLFASHEEYVHEQRRLTRWKLGRGKDRCFTIPAVVSRLHTYMEHWWYSRERQQQLGLCHGVRRGRELELFERLFGGLWLGTEITPELCCGNIICWDFTRENPGWLKRFDLIYSNSFDHARDPLETLRVWYGQLAPGGYLALEWTSWHAKLGRRSRADCLAASRADYAHWLDTAGYYEAELRVKGSDGIDRFLMIGRPL